jgi:PAS domain S-box-containing protein
MPSAAASAAFDLPFRRMVEASPAGVIVVNPRGRIVLINRQIEAWFQYSREELIGELIELLVPDSIRPEHTGLREGYWRNPVERPIGAGRDLSARRRDGSEFPCDISLHPLPTDDGLQVMVHIVDTTERRRIAAEQRQQETIRQLRFMVDNLPAGAVYVSGGELVVNRAVESLTGLPRDALPTVEAWFGRLFGDRAETVALEYRLDRAAGFPETRLLELTRPDGQTRWVEIAAYRDDPHELWLLHDVTAQRLAQERLVQGERLAAIGQMMTALAHESRNALQRARACLEMMQLDLEGQPELLGLAERTQRALDELQRLYEEVRGYAAPLTLERQPTELSALWELVWQQLTQELMLDHHPASARLAIPGPREELMLSLDRPRVAQVFRNIFENSLAVLPRDDGVITIRCGRHESEGRGVSQVSIHDNGPGLNAEQRRRIFEPFYTTKARGTGLGMAIVRRIMEAHGGTIRVGPATEGTEIILEFPLT